MHRSIGRPFSSANRCVSRALQARRLLATSSTAAAAPSKSVEFQSSCAKSAKPAYSAQFLKAIPKSDLHVHLDGSLRVDRFDQQIFSALALTNILTLFVRCTGSLLDIARIEKIPLPALPSHPNVPLSHWTPEMLRADVFKERYQSLVDYLRGFRYTTGVMTSYAALKRAGYEFALDSIADNVFYVGTACQLTSFRACPGSMPFLRVCVQRCASLLSCTPLFQA
jgi:hypothetical protein